MVIHITGLHCSSYKLLSPSCFSHLQNANVVHHRYLSLCPQLILTVIVIIADMCVLLLSIIISILSSGLSVLSSLPSLLGVELVHILVNLAGERDAIQLHSSHKGFAMKSQYCCNIFRAKLPEQYESQHVSQRDCEYF